ncbi:MAG: DUF4065 domain-containing protein [Deltaproteobacteria bacterium]|jgi:uncharacterized phage-associated protein|nr:DUF4065 domain-containing protein [Deltaproteobacteria bacterium]
MPVPYQAPAIANWFIDKNREDNSSLTHFKIQKFLYFSQGFHLANFETPLFEDGIEAWKYGPVVDAVYHALKQYNDDEIVNPIKGHYFLKGKLFFGIPEIESEDDLSIRFLNIFWSKYSKIDPRQLVDMSHDENGPWKLIVQGILEKKTASQVIPKQLIKNYFSTYINKSNIR